MKSECGLFITFLCIAPGSCAQNTDDRVALFATLPDWQGVWETEWRGGADARVSGVLQDRDSDSRRFQSEGGIAELRQRLPLLSDPPYTPEWEAMHQQRLANVADLRALAQSAKLCTTEGFPMALNGPNFFQLLITPEETLMLFDTGEARHVHTDGRSHPAPDEIWPTRFGNSIGTWEDGTLVIDTVARTAGPVNVGPSADLSDHARFTERMRLVDFHTIESVMTIDDPERFTQPWVITLRYFRVPELDRLLSWDCENDRNPVVDGQLQVAPP